MSKMVSTQQQAEANIRHFESELDGSTALQRRLPYARAWYADRDDSGDWHFGPSKFIGYRGMTADEYVNDDPRDGRQTERKLATWFVEVSEADELFEELSDLLVAFLAEYGKAPSTAMRLNISAELHERIKAGAHAPDDRVIADLIIAVVRKLQPAERRRIASAL